jgi:endogenous inhibitor of DNA gyrase (YacG/DUF329 family)
LTERAAMTESTCPICSKPAETDRAKNASWPFCSKRCKMIDLGRWLGEGYRIPADETAAPEEGKEPVPPRGQK